MIKFDAAAAAAERSTRRDLTAKFPDPRRSYLDPPPAVTTKTDVRMTQSTQEAGNGATDGGISPTTGLPLTGISTEELRQELVRRQKRLASLTAQREKLTQQLADVNAEIASLGGGVVPLPDLPRRSGATGVRRARAHNDISLPDAIAMAVEVRATVTPAEAAELVRANGYQTTARNFGILVAHTLAKDPRFKRVERGRYERVS